MTDVVDKMPCSFTGCERPVRANGLCEGHNGQRRRGQDLRPLRQRAKNGTPVRERWESFVDKSGECWMWTGATVTAGHGYGGRYGVLNVDGKNVLAHRLSYRLHIEDPGRWVVGHKCNQPTCVRPEHLYLTDYAGNTADAARDGLIANGSDHYKALLTDEQVRTVRLLSERGHKIDDIAELFKVNRWVVTDVLRGRTYSRVT